jgi:hypothetical protein
MDFSYMQPPSAQEPVLWTVRRTPRVSKLHFDVLAWVVSFWGRSTEVEVFVYE